MSNTNSKDETPFKISSTMLFPNELFPDTEITGFYENIPTIEIKDVLIKSKNDIFSIATQKEIYSRNFVLSRIYIYVDDTENHISFIWMAFLTPMS